MIDILKGLLDYLLTPGILAGVFLFGIKKYWNLYQDLHEERQKRQVEFNETISEKLDELSKSVREEVGELKRDISIIKTQIGIK